MSLRLAIALSVFVVTLLYALIKTRQWSHARQGSAGMVPRGVPPPERPPRATPAVEEQPPPVQERRLISLIRTIPRGRVITFADLSAEAGPGFEVLKISREVRTFAGKEDLPWWRVVRKDGRKGLVSSSASLGKMQRELLEAEGIVFQNESFKLSDYQWRP